MQKNYTQLLLGILIGLVIGFLCAKLLIGKQNPSVTNNPVTYPAKNTQPKQNRVDVNNGEGNFNGNENIPSKVSCIAIHKSQWASNGWLCRW